MSVGPPLFEPVTLWQTDNLRCTFVRRQSPPAFEITIRSGSEIVKRVAFERDEDAAASAILQRRETCHQEQTRNAGVQTPGVYPMSPD
jgi:hypothetical protein